MYYGLPSLIVCIREIAIDLLPRRDYISGGVWFLPQKHGLSSKELLICGCRQPLSAGLPHNFSRRQRKPLSRYLPPPEMSLPSVPTILPPIRSPLFSGRGYTWNTGQVKPDLVAPGVDITSCAVGGGYESRSGTSMAAPFVSGSCALLMQWGILQNNDPFLYGEKNESISDPRCQTASIFRFLPQSAERIRSTLRQQQPDVCVICSTTLR